MNTIIKDIDDVIRLRAQGKILRYLDICEFGAGVSNRLLDDLKDYFEQNLPKIIFVVIIVVFQMRVIKMQIEEIYLNV